MLPYDIHSITFPLIVLNTQNSFHKINSAHKHVNYVPARSNSQDAITSQKGLTLTPFPRHLEG
jgi:hypothetical protein